MADASAVNLPELERRMSAAIDALKKEFDGLRTGRASTNLLENIQVEVYGAKMPINQCASVSVAEARLLNVQVWDAANTKAVEKAISAAGLGLNPQASGTLIRVPLPGLTEERRAELSKVAAKHAEAAKVAVRNIRREGMDTAKKAKMPEDELKGTEEKIQKATDNWIKKIDEALAAKEKDITQV